MKIEFLAKAKPITLGEEITDFLTKDKGKTFFKINIENEGVYKIEYTKDVIESVCVYEKRTGLFQHSRIIDKVRDLQDKNWIELFYLEKGKVYYIDFKLNETMPGKKYSLKILSFEVPANNYKETAKVVDINEVLEGKLDYVTDNDWYKFNVTETGNYKVIYSKEILDSLWFYDDNNENDIPEVSITPKVFLINNTVSEEFYFEKDVDYYLKVKHVSYKSLGNYIVKFIKQ